MLLPIELSNDRIKLLIRPDRGGRIDQITDRRSGKDWLWHSTDYRPADGRSLKIGAPFDDHWEGGWDDVFPNDAPIEFQGRQCADHGELWSQPAELVRETNEEIRMMRACETVPIVVEKAVRLNSSDGGGGFEISYSFRNRSDHEVPYLFKQHPALAIEEGDRFLMPDCQIRAVVPGFGSRLKNDEKMRFADADIRVARSASAKEREFLYASRLTTGFCAIENDRTKTRFKIEFDSASVPYVWIFQSFGGFGDRYVAMLEPSTAIPYDLGVAYREGTCPVLPARGKHEYRFTALVQDL